VPEDATRLYFGFADGYDFQGFPCLYSDNYGSFTVVFDITQSNPWGAAEIPESSTLGSKDLNTSEFFNVLGIVLLPLGLVAVMRRKRK